MFTDVELEHILKALKHLYKNTFNSKDQKKIRLSIINKIEKETNFKSKYLFK